MKAYLKKNIKVGDKEYHRDDVGYVKGVTWGDKTNGDFIYLLDFKEDFMVPIPLSNLDIKGM